MKLSQRNRKQTATRWVAAGNDIYGNSSWTKSTIQVRWEEKQVNAVDYKGNDIVSKAIVYTGEDINIGDYLALGNDASATPPETSFIVRNFLKTPNLRATDFMRKAIL